MKEPIWGFDKTASIEVTKEPTNKNYIEGTAFDPSGMEITVTYTNGTTRVITNPSEYSIEGRILELGQKQIKVIYSEDGVTVDKTYTVPGLSISPKTLTGITVDATSCPKTYKEGDKFDTSKLKVYADYNNGQHIQITSGYTVNDNKELTKGQTTVIVKYTEGTVTRPDIIDGLTVTAKVADVTDIEVDSSEVKKAYIEGESFDASKLKVYEVYSNNGGKKQVTNYKVTGGSNMPAGREKVTISYTAENGNTFTKSVAITVSAIELKSIEVTKAPTKLKYTEGDAFETAGMEVTATYNNNTTKKVTSFTVVDGKSLKAGQTEVTISYKENGITKTASAKGLTVEKSAPTNPVKDDSKYRISGGFIINIQPATKISEFKDNFIDGITVKIYKADGKTQVSSTDKTGTGMIAIFYQGDKKLYEHTIIVKGDCNGDGKADFKDILLINKHRLNKAKLQGAYLEAGDINLDKKVDFKDLLQVNKYRLGKIQSL